MDKEERERKSGFEGRDYPSATLLRSRTPYESSISSNSKVHCWWPLPGSRVALASAGGRSPLVWPGLAAGPGRQPEAQGPTPSAFWSSHQRAARSRSRDHRGPRARATSGPRQVAAVVGPALPHCQRGHIAVAVPPPAAPPQRPVIAAPPSVIYLARSGGRARHAGMLRLGLRAVCTPVQRLIL